MGNYKLNIFKVQDAFSYDETILEVNAAIQNRTRSMCVEKEIQIGENVFKLAYVYALDENPISEVFWKRKLDNIFEINENNEREMHNAYSNYGYIIVGVQGETYIITFGRAHNTVGKLLDLDFGLELAARMINKKEIGLLSSKFFALAKNKSIVEYDNTTFSASIGESIDYIVASIEENHPRTSVKRIIEITDDSAEFNINIKLNIEEENFSLNNLCILIYHINNVLHTYETKINIPKLTLVKPKERELIQRLDNKLTETILSKEESDGKVGVSFFRQKDSNIEILENCSGFVLYRNRSSSEPMAKISLEDIKNFMLQEEIDDINKVKVRYNFPNGFQENEEAKSIIDCTIHLENDDNYYCLNEGKWSKYNKEYLKIIEDNLNEIKEECVFYKPEFDCRLSEINQFAEENEEDIKSSYNTEELENVYKEYRYNYMLSKEKNYLLCDRKNTANKIEVCDLYIDNKELAHVKIGSTQSFCKCMDQSIDGINEYKNNKRDVREKLGINKVEIISLILITDNQTVLREQDISKYESLSFKIKLINWYKYVVENKFIPKIIIAKFEKN